MRLRSRRRDLVIWSLSVSPADKYGDSRLLRPVRRRRVRRALRLSALLTLIGAMRLARGVRYRWRPLLAGTVLAVIARALAVDLRVPEAGWLRCGSSPAN
jgi:hypothetical protein